nr:5' exonuclease Apollo-like [Biomphalaria glabrata]
MNGHIIQNTHIAIDKWEKETAYMYVHFLIHIHDDHTDGLTSTWQKPVYCSEISAQLLVERFEVKKELINILPLNQSTIVPISLSRIQNSTFTVTAFNANHCPGSIILYFEGSFGNVLYTGDFKLSDDIIEQAKKLSGQVDLLYLDNTFCSPQCVFPSQDDCFNQILDIIQKHPSHNVAIGLDKTGKETLLVRLGVHLNETITVSCERYKLCNLLFKTNVFTTSMGEKTSRLTVVSKRKLYQTLRDLNNHSPTIGIIPTAIFAGCSGNTMKNPNLYIVPYSDHCSYTELVQFVSALRPSKVVPIVTGTKDRFNMSCFDAYLSQPHAVSANATNQFSSHSETQILLGDKKVIISEDKKTFVKNSVTMDHSPIDLKAKKYISIEQAAQNTCHNPCDLSDNRSSQKYFFPESLDCKKPKCSSNGSGNIDDKDVKDVHGSWKREFHTFKPSTSCSLIIDLTLESDDATNECTADNDEQEDSKSCLVAYMV